MNPKIFVGVAVAALAVILGGILLWDLPMVRSPTQMSQWIRCSTS